MGRFIRWMWAPVIVGTVLRVLAWLPALTNADVIIGGDTPGYLELARTFRSSYAGDSLLEISLTRPPGYPALLSLLIAGPWSLESAALGHIAFAAVAIALTFHLGSSLLGRPVGLVASWWLALDPLHVVESSVLLTEIVFSVILLAAALVLASARHRGTTPLHWAVVGLLIAFATFMRPITLYLPLLIVLLLVLARPYGLRRSAAAAGALLIAFALPVGAWIARNYAVTGVPTFSTIQAVNLANYRAVGAITEDRKISVAQAREEISALVAARTRPGMNPAEISVVQQQVGIEQIISHPVGYAQSVLEGAARTLAGPGGSRLSVRFGSQAGVGFSLLSLASAVAAAVGAVLGTIYLIRAKKNFELALLAVPLVYLLAIGSGFEAYSRFRMQFFPFLVIVAAFGLTRVYADSRRWWSQRSSEAVARENRSGSDPSRA